MKAGKNLKLLKKKGKLVNIRSIKPFDEECIKSIADNVDVIVTVENHSVKGGLYSTVCEILSASNHKAIVKPVGFHDCFMDAGSASDIKERYGLNMKSIVDSIWGETVRK